MNHPRRVFPLTAFFDVLWNTVLTFLVFFVISYVLIRPEAKPVENTNIEFEGYYVIVVEWDGKTNDDVDTYVLDPDGNLCFFRAKEAGQLYLVRDVLGTSNDTITRPDGSRGSVEKHVERLFIRGISPGEYVVNVHLYAPGSHPFKVVKVRVTLFSLKDWGQKIYEREVELKHIWDEATAFRFTLSPSGEVTDINELPKKLATNLR